MSCEFQFVGEFIRMIPANAPPEYADRNTLWNAAEAVEKQWNFQLARRWVLTIPREIPPDQYAVLVREFCEQQFVSKGMIADFKVAKPTVFIPVFPGTNCEYDSAKAFERAGANTIEIGRAHV